jgi:hypothetical protein
MEKWRGGTAAAAGRRFTGCLKLVARPCPDGHDSGPSHAKRCAYARSQASLLARPEQRGHFFIASGLTRQARSSVEQSVLEAHPPRGLVACSNALSIVEIMVRERVCTADWA